jgi:hypothetical protein
MPFRVRSMLFALGLALASGGPAAAIVGGTPDESALSRSLVMVLKAGGGLCSGVVVAPDAVLTAGHCVAGGQGVADRNALRVHFRDAAGAPVLIEPRSVALHPGFDAKAVAARRRSIDLALVRLPQPLLGFAPATLAGEMPRAGAAIAVSGFGLTADGKPETTGILRRASLSVVEPYGPSQILLWAKGRDSGACLGDSGGALVSGERGVAVTSWATGAKGRSCGDLTQGILLGPQRDWIDRTLSGWSVQARWAP